MVPQPRPEDALVNCVDRLRGRALLSASRLRDPLAARQRRTGREPAPTPEGGEPMTKTTWTFAPAGVLGQGIADVRPYPGVVVCPTVDSVQGTGLPAGAFAAEVRGVFPADATRLRTLPGQVAVLARTDAPTAQK